ncbi:unnamed protein product [Prorocentrum cordatum]|uniref:Mcm6 C-terminal winged-helix domain-containing protein n=1 Tax=Prorocentrum cordatum TaxID=2364126 RepID=A0ABN9XL48_9DINO|nr:unnamed protein product [Polarella glacialis]
MSAHAGGGKLWAAASARTLTRRLRWELQAERGVSRAAALARRIKALRSSVDVNWRLGDAVGRHLPTLGEEVATARLLGCDPAPLAEADAALAEGNAARHAPPPGAAKGLAKVPDGLDARAFERLLTGAVSPLSADAKPFEPAADGMVSTLLCELGVEQDDSASDCKLSVDSHDVPQAEQEDLGAQVVGLVRSTDCTLSRPIGAGAASGVVSRYPLANDAAILSGLSEEEQPEGPVIQDAFDFGAAECVHGDVDAPLIGHVVHGGCSGDPYPSRRAVGDGVPQDAVHDEPADLRLDVDRDHVHGDADLLALGFFPGDADRTVDRPGGLGHGEADAVPDGEGRAGADRDGVHHDPAQCDVDRVALGLVLGDVDCVVSRIGHALLHHLVQQQDAGTTIHEGDLVARYLEQIEDSIESEAQPTECEMKLLDLIDKLIDEDFLSASRPTVGLSRASRFLVLRSCLRVRGILGVAQVAIPRVVRSATPKEPQKAAPRAAEVADPRAALCATPSAPPV